MSRSRQLSVYLVASCLAFAACGGDDPDDAGPQPTTTAPSTTQPQDPDEQALRSLAEAWYETIRQIYDEGAETSTASDYLTEPYLGAFVRQVEEYRSGDETIESSPRSSHEVRSVEVNGDAAVVVECVIDADIVRAADGAVVNDSVVAKLYSTSAERTEEGWRLRDRETLVEQEGDECAEP